LGKRTRCDFDDGVAERPNLAGSHPAIAWRFCGFGRADILEFPGEEADHARATDAAAAACANDTYCAAAGTLEEGFAGPALDLAVKAGESGLQGGWRGYDLRRHWLR
jgi:hypothetical protein